MIIDISNPSSPILKGRYTGNIGDVSVFGNYAYLVDLDNGLVIIDISNPSSPVLKRNYDTRGYVVDVSVSDSYVYVAEGVNGLVILKANP
jgi:hypothetical protein